MGWPQNEKRINGGKTGYKDRDGVDIEFGDVVAQRITLNYDTFKGFPFAVYIVVDTDDGPTLSGVHTFGELKHLHPPDLKVLRYDTNLRGLATEFYQMRRADDLLDAE